MPRALVFPVAGTAAAVPLAAAREVVVDPVATPLPTAPPSVLGLFDLRGESVPLFDGAPLLRLPGRSGRGYAVVVACAAGIAGLATEGPVDLVPLTGGDTPAVLEVEVLLG